VKKKKGEWKIRSWGWGKKSGIPKFAINFYCKKKKSREES